MNLRGELASGRDDDGGNMVLLGWFSEAQKFLDKRNEESKCLAATSDGLFKYEISIVK